MSRPSQPDITLADVAVLLGATKAARPDRVVQRYLRRLESKHHVAILRLQTDWQKPCKANPWLVDRTLLRSLDPDLFSQKPLTAAEELLAEIQHLRADNR